MKLGRDGVTQLDDDQEDLTVAPVVDETEEQKAKRLADEEAARVAAEADGEVVPPVVPPVVEDEVVVTIGEESPPSDEDDSKAPEWVRDLRKSHRELQRENRELRAKQEKGNNEPAPVTVGEKPKLEDFEYDAEKFAAALEGWHDRKRAADDATAKQQETEKAAKAAWQVTLDAYGTAKAKLKVKDADEAEAVVQEHLTVTQQGVILAGAEHPALLIYALGKNPKKAKELASIKDPVKFAFAVAKLEMQVKSTPRKPPPPEPVVIGSAPKTGAVDSQLEKLRAEAEKTGDHSKVAAYKRAQRQKAAA